MKFSDLFQETYSSLTVNKARSILTMLGIIIGIGSVIAMVGLGQGAQKDIESRITSIGSNLLTIYPGAAGGVGFRGISQGAGSAQSLSTDDVDAIAAHIDTVAAIDPEVSSRNQVTAKGTNTNTSVIGTTEDYLTVKNTELDSGSFISAQHVKSLSKVAVLGPDTRDDLFGEGSDPIGQKIRIKNISFTVIGTTKAKGGGGFGSSDDMVIIPLSTAQRFLTGNEYLGSISVQVQDQESMQAAEDAITALLLSEHGISDPTQADFNVFNQADIVETASAVTNTLTMLLGAVAGISLIVGGIGIMNMMLTTVTERTREIGLRKSLGAKKRDISRQFLAESIALTFIGGVIGVVCGWAAATMISKFGGITTAVNLFPVLLAFGVSAAIGIIFGYYPARRAAALNPIEALRYE